MFPWAEDHPALVILCPKACFFVSISFRTFRLSLDETRRDRPHYGQTILSCDYFNRNLMFLMYVMADISRNENSIIVYYERLMGKYKNDFFSPRLSYVILIQSILEAEGNEMTKLIISVRDNWLTHSKSNAAMKYVLFNLFCFIIGCFCFFSYQSTVKLQRTGLSMMVRRRYRVRKSIIHPT